jgi:dipeptidyl aminopeptidase/acylaminoacyl peptidase
MRIRSHTGFAFAVAALITSMPSLGQVEARQPMLSLSDIGQAIDVSDPKISPDGKWILYQEARFNPKTLERLTTYHLYSVKKSSSIELGPIASPTWSADSAVIAYVDDRGIKNAVAIKTFAVATGERRIVGLVPSAEKLSLSPDGRTIAFEASVPAPVSSSLPKTKASDFDVVFDTLHVYDEDSATGLIDPSVRNHIFLMNTADGKVRQLTAGDWNVGAHETGASGNWSGPVSWSPDGHTIYFAALISTDFDTRQKEAHIHSVDVASGKIQTIAAASPGGHAFFVDPLPSPDGRKLAWIGHRREHGRIVIQSQLWLANADGTNAHLAAPELDTPVDEGHLAWAPDGKSILFSGPKLGFRHVFRVPVDGRQTRRIGDLPETQVKFGSISQTGMIAALRSTFTRADEIVLVNLAKPRQAQSITPYVQALFSSRRMPGVQEVNWRGEDGFEHGGFLYTPADYDPAKRYPLLLRIHGGPEVMHTGAAGAASGAINARAWTDRGYLVFWTAYRGTLGRGEEYANMQLDRKHVETRGRDIERGIDAISAIRSVDADRVYLEGKSYGGLVGSWIISHSPCRFAAAVISVPLVNSISQAGTTDEPAWAYARYPEPFWEDPMTWTQTSPIMSAGNVRTPTMVVVGEFDRRTPPAQGQEFYSALKISGKAPTRLVIMRNMQHIDRWPAPVLLHYFDRIDEWIAQHPRRIPSAGCPAGALG